MHHSRWSDFGTAQAACLALLAASCRNDGSANAGGVAGTGAAAPAASGAAVTIEPSAPLAIDVRKTLPPASTSAGGAAPAPPTAAASDRGAECAGPPSGPLPTLEERKLAAQKPGQYRFALRYPAFHEDDEQVTQKLNRSVLEQLTAIQKRFIAEAESQGVTNPDDARWFEGTCSTAYHSKSFVSVACDTMEGPGAHPNVDKFAYDFEICPEVRQLALSDLCRSLPDCRKKIIALINEDFRTGEKKQTGIQFRAGPAPHGESSDPEHPVAALRTFAITPAGLRFYLFDELPHVLQAFAVVDIPAAKLRPVLREELVRRIWAPDGKSGK